MKWLIAAWLVLIVPAVHAVECGSLIMQNRVEHLKKSLTAANEMLRQHRMSLLNEAGTLLGNTPSDAILNQVAKINREHDLLVGVISDGESVQGPLDTVSTLVSIRDVMVDKRDKMIVELNISLNAVHTKKMAELSYRTTNESLTQMSRPGVAIDVSKLRDTIGLVLGELQKCELPKMPSRGPQTRQ